MKLSKVLADKRNEGRLYTVPVGTVVQEAAKKMTSLRIGALLVIEQNEGVSKYVGIVTESDLIRAISEEMSNIRTDKVDDYMTRRMIVANVNDDVEYVMNVMLRHNISHLPIICEKTICSIVSRTDILNSLNQEKEIEIQWLNDYTGAPCGEKHQVF